MKDLFNFIASHDRNAYIYCKRFTIYVRKGFHNIAELGPCHTFDIANINLPEQLRGRGKFPILLGHIEQELIKSNCGLGIIYIENVQNKGFLDSLLRQGFTYANYDDRYSGSVTVYRHVIRRIDAASPSV